MNEIAKPRRRWLRFGLGTMLLGLTVVCVVFALIAEHAGRQRRAVEMVSRLGGMVGYAHQREQVPGFGFDLIEPARPPGPPWLRWLLGDDYFMRVTQVTILPPDPLPGEQATGERMSSADFALLSGLPDLEALRLADVSITDDDLRHLSGLVKLQALIVSGSQIGDAGLAHLSKLRELTSLSLVDDPAIQRTPERFVTDDGLRHLKDLVKLQTLSVRPMRVSDAGPASLKHLNQLENIALAFEPGTRTTMEWLPHWPTISLLHLDHASLSPESWPRLAASKNLEYLFLTNCELTDEALVQLSSLRELELRDSPIVGSGFSGLTKLEELSLRGAWVTDETLKHLRPLPRLKSLELHDSNITDAGLPELDPLHTLEMLTLTHARISDEGLASLAGLQSLYFLSLEDTPITDAGLDVLKKLTLRILRLLRSQVTPDAVERFRQATGAQVFTGAEP